MQFLGLQTLPDKTAYTIGENYTDEGMVIKLNTKYVAEKSKNSTQEKTNMFQLYPKYTRKFNGGKELKVGANYQFIRYNDETDGLSKCEPFCYEMPITNYYIERMDAEVIGNIFDNKELLESEE